MRNKYSTFLDGSLICFGAFTPINIESARIETKTFVLLLATAIKQGREDQEVDRVVDEFYRHYDKLPPKIDEVAEFAGSLALLGSDPPLDDVVALERLQSERLYEVGKRRQAISDVIKELHGNLYYATSYKNRDWFVELLKRATVELDEKVEHFRSLMTEID